MIDHPGLEIVLKLRLDKLLVLIFKKQTSCLPFGKLISKLMK